MKTTTKKTSQKQLTASISEKFMHALTELGHDAESLKKEIKKASKTVAKKIGKKYTEVKDAVAGTIESIAVEKAVETVEKTAAAAKKSVVKKVGKVEKVIAKATKTAEQKMKKTAVAKLNPLPQFEEDVVTPAAPAKRAVKKPAATAAEKTALAKPVKRTYNRVKPIVKP